MNETTMKVTEMIDRMVAAFADPERRRYEPAQRFELLGSDGKSYSGMGLPHGVTAVGRGKEYWVLMSVREGTTHGKRFDSKAELVKDFESSVERRANEWRATLEQMDDKELEAQAGYWLKGDK